MVGSRAPTTSTAIVTRILHIEGGRLKAYAGNYSAFETQHAAHAERSAALAAKQATKTIPIVMAAAFDPDGASAPKRARRARYKAA